MILARDIGWWYWATTDVLLIGGLGFRPGALYAAAALSLLSTVHFSLRERSVTAFPVQVRCTYAAFHCLGLWPPIRQLLWLPAAGTLVMVLFRYCLLARSLSLLPWNRREPLSWQLLRRTFLSPPRAGNVLQGLPAGH